MRATPSQLFCPSAPAEPDAIIIGAVGPDGSLGYFKDKLTATREFLDAQASKQPEQRFRFSSPCQRCACSQWVNGAMQSTGSFV